MYDNLHENLELEMSEYKKCTYVFAYRVDLSRLGAGIHGGRREKLHPKPTPGPGGVLETKGKFSIRNFQPLESLNPITMELAFWKFVELYRYLVFQKGF